MFGGLVTTTTVNSPHLRKSGSRVVVSDPVELGNSVEVFSDAIEVNEMKGVSAPLSTTAILPSPVLLWRFKVLLFFVWGFACCKVSIKSLVFSHCCKGLFFYNLCRLICECNLQISWDSVMRMSVNLRDLFLYEAFLYYNPLLLVTMMVWFWGVNLWVFMQSNVNYAKIFDVDQNHLSHREIWRCATWMTIIVPTSMTAYLYLYSHGEVSLAASQPV
nr:SPX and EXS domain-containing protein 1-like [Ipomoea batatas]